MLVLLFVCVLCTGGTSELSHKSAAGEIGSSVNPADNLSSSNLLNSTDHNVTSKNAHDINPDQNNTESKSASPKEKQNELKNSSPDTSTDHPNSKSVSASLSEEQHSNSMAGKDKDLHLNLLDNPENKESETVHPNGTKQCVTKSINSGENTSESPTQVNLSKSKRKLGSSTPHKTNLSASRRHSGTKSSSPNVHLDPSDSPSELGASTPRRTNPWRQRRFSMFGRMNVSPNAYLNSLGSDSESGLSTPGGKNKLASKNESKGLSLMSTYANFFRYIVCLSYNVSCMYRL